jgi:hypothetical protein
MKSCRPKLKKLALDAEIKGLGVKLELSASKTNYNGIRFWFACPICSRRTGVLFHHPLTRQIGCRTCLNLDYATRQYKPK